MENALLIGAVIAVGVAVVATAAALRAGRRARKAADLVSQLLDPPVVVEVAPAPAADAPRAPGVRADSSPHDARATSIAEISVVEDDHGGARRRAAGAGRRSFGDADTLQARIPVLDLDRLRSWLTAGDVDLGRLAIVSVELDNLTLVQQRLGDAAGTHLIEAITQRLRTATRPRDVIAHVNRERFVLVCRDVPDAKAAEVLGERIAMGVAHPSVVLAGVAEVTASIGVALATSSDERPESVLRRAIKAGNRARALGGARIEVSAGSPATPIGEGDLAAALARGEFRVHYLPIVSCATGRVAGFEALVRWKHPEHGLLLPGEFLPEAERSGMVVPIGTWALEEACRQMSVWHDGTGATLKLDVNLSARQFTEPTMPAQVKRILGETGLVPGSVWLEMTEETLSRDRTASDATLGQLQEVGVRLVIDDFGTGASSLVSLKRFPIDAIKIASTFVGDLGKDRDSDAICSAIVDLAHSLGLCAIAEGVEDLEQFAALRALGCELAQGHLFGAARSAEAYGDAPASTMGVVRTSNG